MGAIRNYSLGKQAVPGPSVNINTNFTHSKKSFSGSHFKISFIGKQLINYS